MMVVTLLVGGLVLELVGVVLMSSALLTGAAKWSDQVTLLGSALVRGPQARGRTRTLEDLHGILGLRKKPSGDPSGTPEPEDRIRLLDAMLDRDADTRLKALQGLAFLGLGILIQGIVTVVLMLQPNG